MPYQEEIHYFISSDMMLFRERMHGIEYNHDDGSCRFDLPNLSAQFIDKQPMRAIP